MNSNILDILSYILIGSTIGALTTIVVAFVKLRLKDVENKIIPYSYRNKDWVNLEAKIYMVKYGEEYSKHLKALDEHDGEGEDIVLESNTEQITHKHVSYYGSTKVVETLL